MSKVQSSKAFYFELAAVGILNVATQGFVWLVHDPATGGYETQWMIGYVVLWFIMTSVCNMVMVPLPSLQNTMPYTDDAVEKLVTSHTLTGYSLCMRRAVIFMESTSWKSHLIHLSLPFSSLNTGLKHSVCNTHQPIQGPWCANVFLRVPMAKKDEP